MHIHTNIIMLSDYTTYPVRNRDDTMKPKLLLYLPVNITDV